MYLVGLHLDLSNVLVKLAQSDLLLESAEFEPLAFHLTTQQLTRVQKNNELRENLQLVNFTRRPPGHLWEDEPSDRHRDQAGTRKAAAHHQYCVIHHDSHFITDRLTKTLS